MLCSVSRTLVPIVLVFSASVSVLAQQSNRRNEQPDAKNEPQTLSGCVAKPGAPQAPLTLADEAGFKYRLSGKSVSKFIGKRVELIGETPAPKRFAVRGGLWPSPNVAAQAGAIDPAKASVARMPGGSESGTGTDDATLLPEFRVTRVRELPGSCK